MSNTPYQEFLGGILKTAAEMANASWVIDPIDGTSNFAQSVPLYGIMIGLLQNIIHAVDYRH